MQTSLIGSFRTLPVAERVLLICVLLFGSLIALLLRTDPQTRIALVWLFQVALLALIAFYISRNHNILSTSMLWLLGASVLSNLFRLLHLQGTDMLFLAGVVGGVLLGIMIVWKAFSGKHTDSEIYYITAAAVIAHALIMIGGIPDAQNYTRVINYIFVALIGTLKLRDSELDYGIDKMLGIYLLLSVVAILRDTAEYIL